MYIQLWKKITNSIIPKLEYSVFTILISSVYTNRVHQTTKKYYIKLCKCKINLNKRWHEMIEYNRWVNWWGTLIIHGSVYMYINAIRWQHKQDPNNAGSLGYQLSNAVVSYFRKYKLWYHYTIFRTEWIGTPIPWKEIGIHVLSFEVVRLLKLVLGPISENFYECKFPVWSLF